MAIFFVGMMDLQANCARAAALHKAGDMDGAERLYRAVLDAAPDYIPALSLFGVLRAAQGRKDEALGLMEKAARLGPDSLPAQMNYAALLQEVGRHQDALAVWDRLAAQKPAASVFNQCANLLGMLGREDEALAAYDRALALEPGNERIWYNRGILLEKRKNLGDAEASFSRALALKPDFAAALNNRAHLRRQLGRNQEALADLDRALAAQPADMAMLYNRATLLSALKRYDEALAGFNAVLAREPDNAAALSARGMLLWDRFRRYEPALADMERALALGPRADWARGDLLHLKMLGGVWQGFDQELALIDEGVRDGKPVIRPFAHQALSASPQALHKSAMLFTDRVYPPLPALCKSKRGNHGRIRVGYLCGAFNKHALAYLAAGLYEAHDRNRFEIIALDAGRNDNSAIRARLESAFDKFIPIAALSDQEAAEKILSEEIDILVNVDGYSGHLRMGVFARRPAPVQVNWLGFPGTLGANYIDYIIADPIVIPESDRRFFSEKIVTLPHAYQVNDSKRAIAGSAGTKADHGLPENGFVFCNFNQSYKLTPSHFSLFLKIMKQVPGSVLWLLEANEVFHANLRAQAAHQGVDASRLIFAPIIPIEDHLARLSLADLFLDTLPYNAHTTCSDALWAGLPLLTCRGTAFAGRVAASLISVMGVPELITGNLEEFESLALKLAREPDLMKALRDKIAANRASSPLFDTDLYRRHIEAAYQTMWDIAQAGGAPRDFRVALQ